MPKYIAIDLELICIWSLVASTNKQRPLQQQLSMCCMWVCWSF